MDSDDRSANQQANQLQTSAGNAAQTAGANAASDRALLMPTLRADLSGNNGLNATQRNNLLVASQQGTGGASAGLAGTAGLTAARSRNSGALSGTLDAIARARNQTASQAGLGVQNESQQLANQRENQALGQVQGLYGTDVSSQLKGMGLQNEAINSELAADKTGWLQNAEGVADTLSGMGKNAAGAFAGLQ